MDHDLDLEELERLVRRAGLRLDREELVAILPAAAAARRGLAALDDVGRDVEPAVQYRIL